MTKKNATPVVDATIVGNGLPEGFLTSKIEIMQAIAAGKEAYQQSRAWVHARASEVLYHAAQFGDADTLKALHDMVSKNDRASFISWVRKVSSYVTSEGKTRSWLKYTTEKGFQVLTHSEAHRKDKFTPAELLAKTPFFEVERAARVAVAKDLKALRAIESSIRDVKTIVSRFETYGVAPSAEVDEAIKTLKTFLVGQLPADEAPIQNAEDAGMERAA